MKIYKLKNLAVSAVLLILLMPLVMAELQASISMTPVVVREKKIYEDNIWFWVALTATILAIIYYSAVFYKRLSRKI